MVDQRKDVTELIKDVRLERLTVEQVKPIMSHIQNLWDEVDQRNKAMKLDPDYSLYEQLEASDQWFFYTATYKGKMSLYSFFIQPSLHVKGTKQLISDFIYVDPEHRGTGIADILILASEDQAEQQGATLLVVTLKDFDRHDSLVERRGYTLFENSFQKVI